MIRRVYTSDAMHFLQGSSSIQVGVNDLVWWTTGTDPNIGAKWADILVDTKCARIISMHNQAALGPFCRYTLVDDCFEFSAA
jgi:hypothetical protein